MHTPLKAVTLLLLAACAGSGSSPGSAQPIDDARHPAALQGGWIDLRHTAEGDTSVWVLRSGGEDRGLRIRAETKHHPLRVKDRGHGRWSVRDGKLCFNQRPGRSGDSCTAFTLDTAVVNGRPRRRLTVLGYVGSRHTGDRVLLERP